LGDCFSQLRSTVKGTQLTAMGKDISEKLDDTPSTTLRKEGRLYLETD